MTGAPGVPLPVVTAQELLAEQLGEQAWLIPGMIPVGGFVVLYGAPKSGKTTIAMHMAASLVKAQPFLGGEPSLPWGALWFDFEQPRRVTKKRFEEVRANTALGQFYVYQGAPKDAADLFATIDRCKPDVVFVDSLSRWLRLEDENSNAELNRALGPILSEFQRRDITLVVIHHDRKSEGDGGRNLRGASALLAMSDVTIEVRVEGDADSDRRRLNIVSRHDGMQQKLVRRTPAGFVDDGSPVEHRERQILQALASGPQTREELADALALTDRGLRGVLDAMVMRDVVLRTGSGRRGDPFKFALPPNSAVSVKRGEFRERDSFPSTPIGGREMKTGWKSAA